MFIRGMKAGDFREICRMLVQEDEGDGCLLLNSYNTYILDDGNGIVGFFMVTMEQTSGQTLPSLRYFVVKKERRSMNMARELMNKYKEFVKKRGFKASLVVVKKDYLRKFVEYYFKRKPYGRKDGFWFFLVEV